MISSSPEATRAIARRLALRLRRGDCVALFGPMGSGKTTFVQGLARGIGCAGATSPTFKILNTYRGRIPLHHLDLYRVKKYGPLADMVEECLSDGAASIEWAERAGRMLPLPRREVRLSSLSPTKRRITIRSVRAGKS